MGLPHPVAARLNWIYEQSGFPQMPEGQGVVAAALRGSTAAYCTDHSLRFRHQRSDVDIVAISEAPVLTRPRYRFFDIVDSMAGSREMDILCLTPSNLQSEADRRYHVFLASKLVQPAIPFIAADLYERFAVEAMTLLIRRGLARRGLNRLTPSGAARLVIEEDIFAEPWRWQSLHTYYVASPTAVTQRRRLGALCFDALRQLQGQGMATDVSAQYAMPLEPAFAVEPNSISGVGRPSRRSWTILTFVFDQFSTLFRSGKKGFTPAQAARLMMKAASLRANPLLRYDADIIFKRV